MSFCYDLSLIEKHVRCSYNVPQRVRLVGPPTSSLANSENKLHDGNKMANQIETKNTTTTMLHEIGQPRVNIEHKPLLDLAFSSSRTLMYLSTA